MQATAVGRDLDESPAADSPDPMVVERRQPATVSTGAEAVLRLRALRGNGDFDDYVTFHRTQANHRNHTSRNWTDDAPDHPGYALAS